MKKLVVALVAGGTLMMAMTGGMSATGFFDDATQACSNAPISAVPVSLPGFTPEQLGNASKIAAYGFANGFNVRDVTVALMAAMQESSLVNQKGGTSDSAGLFQMRPGLIQANGLPYWGTYEQVTDVDYAIARFYKEMTDKVPNREGMDLGVIAQTIEVSKYPDAYSQWEQQATEMATQAEGGSADQNVGVVFTSTCNPSNSGDQNPFAPVNTAGYAWPVAPGTKSANSKVSGLSPLPCGSITGCHHDHTPALDLGVQPGEDAQVGTPEYAISDGVIDSVKDNYHGFAGCFSIAFTSSLDHFHYWYGHTQNPVVVAGQTVKAGQQISEIGRRDCTGNGSTPHLHLDRGCVINGVPQPGGSDNCRDPGFIALMNSIFAGLPE